MKRLRILLPALLVLLALSACATSSGAGDGAPTRYRSSDVITPEEVRDSRDSNAHDLVQRLRPRWLRIRGRARGEVDPIWVFRDVHREGTVETLRTISRADVGWMEWVNALEANRRWGAGHSSGAIVVHSSGAPDPPV